MLDNSKLENNFYNNVTIKIRNNCINNNEEVFKIYNKIKPYWMNNPWSFVELFVISILFTVATKLYY